MFGLTGNGNKTTVNSVSVMFWFHRTYMVVIGKRVQTSEKLKLWLTNSNRNFKETKYTKASSNVTSQALNKTYG